MQILTISHSRQPQKVWLKFDNDLLLPFKIDDLVTLNVKKFIELDEAALAKIQAASARFIMTEHALRQIAISPKTSKLLSQKLTNYQRLIQKKYNYPSLITSGLIELIVQEISAHGLLDDTKFIEYYVRRHSKMSQMQIKYNLQSLGLKYSSLESDHDKVAKIIFQKSKTADLTDFNTKNKLIASLYRKGFAINLVKTVIDEYLTNC